MFNLAAKWHKGSGGEEYKALSEGVTPRQIVELSSFYYIAVYANSMFARRVCDWIPDHAFLRGGTLTIGGELSNSHEIISAVSSWLSPPHRGASGVFVSDEFPRAQRLANRLKGAAIVLLVADGGRFDEPVDVDKIQSVDGIRVFSSDEIYPFWDENTRWSGRPEPDFYHLLKAGGSEEIGAKIHASRVLPFYGDSLDGHNEFSYDGWPSISKLYGISEEIINRDIATESVVDLLQKARIFLYGVKNLEARLGRDAQRARRKSNFLATIKSELTELLKALQSLNVFAYDSETREISSETYSFAGQAELLELLTKQRVEATDLPACIVLGEHSTGLGQVESGERAAVADALKAQQSAWDRNLKTLIYYFLRSKNSITNGIEPPFWDWEWNPIYATDPLSEARVNATESGVILNYVRMSEIYQRMGLETPLILSPKEIRQSTFGGSKFDALNITLQSEDAQQIAADSYQWSQNGSTYSISEKNMTISDGKTTAPVVLEDGFIASIRKGKHPPARVYKLTLREPGDNAAISVCAIGFISGDAAVAYTRLKHPNKQIESSVLVEDGNDLYLVESAWRDYFEEEN